MKVYIIKDKNDEKVVNIKSFGIREPKDAANKIYNLLVKDISAHTFDLVIKKLCSEKLIRGRNNE